jgi:hypothetical protein
MFAYKAISTSVILILLCVLIYLHLQILSIIQLPSLSAVVTRSTSTIESSTAKPIHSLEHPPSPITAILTTNAESLRSRSIPLNRPRFNAMVISNSSQRYQSTHQVLSKYNFNITQVVPPDLTSKEVIKLYHEILPTINADYETRLNLKQKRLLNNYYVLHSIFTHFGTMNSTSTDGSSSIENDWLFIFEDDVKLHASVDEKTLLDSIVTGLELSEELGLMYMGKIQDYSLEADV